MEVPKRLYKYRAGTIHDIFGLSGAKLWFSSPTRFNDPFDCAYDIALSSFSRADCITILSNATDGAIVDRHVSNHSDDYLTEQVSAGAKTVVKGALNKVKGVCCFSAVHDNVLMWGHYANGHQGFCLEFDTATEALFKRTHAVEYSQSLPTISAETFTKEDYGQVMKLFLTKAECWKYEQEWRVLHKDSEFAFSYSRLSLTGVYFGAKMPDEHILALAMLLQNTNTKLYRMRLSKTSFALTSEPLTFTPTDYRSAATTE